MSTSSGIAPLIYLKLGPAEQLITAVQRSLDVQRYVEAWDGENKHETWRAPLDLWFLVGHFTRGYEVDHLAAARRASNL